MTMFPGDRTLKNSTFIYLIVLVCMQVRRKLSGVSSPFQHVAWWEVILLTWNRTFLRRIIL